jgi:hypothetical protein
VTQHASLTAERWASYARDDQLLMIANEMNRAARLARPEDLPGFRRSCERVLRLVDLTVEVNAARSLRRELLRFRDLVAALYIDPAPPAEAHRQAFRALLLLTPATARQIPFLVAGR